MSKLVLSIILSLTMFVSGCNTLQNYNQKAEEEKQRKISTAKINVQLGLAYLERQNLQRAKRKLALALDQAPAIPEPWYSMAYFYEATGEKELASKYYLKAIELAPNRGDTHNNYGTYLCRQGQYRQAVQQFMLAVKDENYLDPSSAYENAGICAAKIPDKKLATYYLDHAIQQDPNRPVALYKLAHLYYEEGKFQAAKTRLMQFSAIAPHNNESLTLRAKIENKLLAERKADEVARISFTKFMALAKKTPLTASAAPNQKILRKQFLKPANVKVVPLQSKTARPTHVNNVPMQKIATRDKAKTVKPPTVKLDLSDHSAVKVIPLKEAQALLAKQHPHKMLAHANPQAQKSLTAQALKKDPRLRQKVLKTKPMNPKAKPKALAKNKPAPKHVKLVTKTTKDLKPTLKKNHIPA